MTIPGMRCQRLALAATRLLTTYIAASAVRIHTCRRLLSLFLNPLPCDLVPTPLAAGRCLLVRENQAIPFEPKIAVLIGSDVVRPRPHLWSMNYSVLFLTHLVGAAIGKERVIRVELLRVGRFFRVYPMRVIRIGERHAHMTRGVVHEVANWVRAILRIRLECSIAPECPGRNHPPSPD